MNALILSGSAYATTAIVSGLIGAWASARWNFRYQRRLLDQQLEFQRKSQEQTEAFIRSVAADIRSVAADMLRIVETIARRQPSGIGHPDTNPAAQRHTKF